MRRVFKWLFWLFAGIAVLGVCVAAISYSVLSNFLPANDGKAEISGLSAPVEVVFDANAIPHINAATQADASRVLGYLHARERLWQMEVLRMAGQGRLSEVFGEPAIGSDKYLRTLGLDRHARQSFETLAPETRAIMTAYTEGINAWLNRSRGMLEPQLPPEFMILGHSPEPWEPWQAALPVKIMALRLASNSSFEILRLALAARGFGPREIEDVVTYNDRDDVKPLPDLRRLYGFGAKGKTATLRDTGQLPQFLFPTGETASNNWVVAGSRTESGKPVLANDPHLGFSAPSVFYLAHLSFELDGARRDVIGGTIPGIPFVIIGRNNKVAWGQTTTYLDSQDLYIEQVNPDNPDQYRTENGWEDFEFREEEIRVSGKPEAETYTVRATRHGPVLPDTYRSLKKLLPDGHVAALRWNALTGDDTTMDALRGMNLAQSVPEVRTALRALVSPMQSIVVADVEGNIGLFAPGRVPLRKAGNIVNGRAPVPGWMPVFEWQGFMDADATPRFVNPPQGALATANSNFLPEEYAGHITHDWAESYRQERVETLVVKGNAKHSPERALEVMGDTYSPALVKFRDVALALMPQSATLDSGLVSALQAWDGHMDQAKSEPLVVLAWCRHLHRMIFADEMGDQYRLMQRTPITPVINVLEQGGVRDWCDRSGTPEREECGALAGNALAAAVEELSKRFGEDWKKWRYGAAHIAYGEHTPFAKVGPLASFFNVEVPFSGGPYTLLRGQTDFHTEAPYRSVHGAAMRTIHDMSDPEKSRFIQSTGQSGHFLSEHYRDFAGPWSRMELLPMQTKQENYTPGKTGTWQFDPAS